MHQWVNRSITLSLIGRKVAKVIALSVLLASRYFKHPQHLQLSSPAVSIGSMQYIILRLGCLLALKGQRSGTLRTGDWITTNYARRPDIPGEIKWIRCQAFSHDVPHYICSKTLSPAGRASTVFARLGAPFFSFSLFLPAPQRFVSFFAESIHRSGKW